MFFWVNVTSKFTNFCWPKTGLPSQKFLEPPLHWSWKRLSADSIRDSIRTEISDRRSLLFDPPCRNPAKSVPRGKAIWNANGGFVSVLLTHLFLFGFCSVFEKNSDSVRNEFCSVEKMQFGSDIIVIYYCCNSWVVNLQRQLVTWLWHYSTQWQVKLII